MESINKTPRNREKNDDYQEGGGGDRGDVGQKNKLPVKRQINSGGLMYTVGIVVDNTMLIILCFIL